MPIFWRGAVRAAKQGAVDHDRTTDARAEREQRPYASPTRRTKDVFAPRCRIGVVFQGHWHIECRFEHLLDIAIAPRQMGGKAHRAAFCIEESRHGDTNRLHIVLAL